MFKLQRNEVQHGTSATIKFATKLVRNDTILFAIIGATNWHSLDHYKFSVHVNMWQIMEIK